MKTEYVPFADRMIPDAGQLLAERHAQNHKLLALLPPRFENPEIATQALERLWQNKFKNGYAAFRHGKLIAYLIGETTTQAWGRSGDVYLPGYALADGENPAILQDLYALLGDDWVKKGCFNHSLSVSAADATILNALFDLGFGKERVDALLDFGSLKTPDLEKPTGVTIRQAGKGDHADLGGFSHLIFQALAMTPYWHPTIPEDWSELYEGWSELADDKAWTIWLALEKQEALGMVGFRSEEEADTHMLVSSKTAYLSVAATQPQARGRGISSALTWHGLAQARKAGFEICYTNWISPNLLASRFWPRFGFKDVVYRVAKIVNPMIAWAKYESSSE